MKKLIITFILLSLFLFTGCVNKKKNNISIELYDADGNLINTQQSLSSSIVNDFPNVESIKVGSLIKNSGTDPIMVFATISADAQIVSSIYENGINMFNSEYKTNLDSIGNRHSSNDCIISTGGSEHKDSNGDNIGSVYCNIPNGVPLFKNNVLIYKSDLINVNKLGNGKHDIYLDIYVVSYEQWKEQNFPPVDKLDQYRDKIQQFTVQDKYTLTIEDDVEMKKAVHIDIEYESGVIDLKKEEKINSCPVPLVYKNYNGKEYCQGSFEFYDDSSDKELTKEKAYEYLQLCNIKEISDNSRAELDVDCFDEGFEQGKIVGLEGNYCMIYLSCLIK